MADEKLYVLASDVAISEQKSNDIFLLVEMRILSTRPNGNAEGVTPQFIDEVVAHPEKYACLPLYADVERLFSEATGHFGDIDILINNAGISHIGLLQDMSIEEWNNIVNTNLSSVFFCCKLAIPGMVRKQSGSIINISSVWGVAGASCEAAYSATKGGINSFTKALAKELAPSGINVNAIACGVMDTDMNHCFSDEEMQDIIEEIPAGRMGAPDEAASLALSISEGTSYLTGQVIVLDGGYI